MSGFGILRVWQVGRNTAMASLMRPPRPRRVDELGRALVAERDRICSQHRVFCNMSVLTSLEVYEEKPPQNWFVELDFLERDLTVEWREGADKIAFSAALWHHFGVATGYEWSWIIVRTLPSWARMLLAAFPCKVPIPDSVPVAIEMTANQTCWSVICAHSAATITLQAQPTWVTLFQMAGQHVLPGVAVLQKSPLETYIWCAASLKVAFFSAGIFALRGSQVRQPAEGEAISLRKTRLCCQTVAMCSRWSSRACRKCDRK